MPLQTHFESKFYRIAVDQERNLLLAKWLRPITTEEIILGGTKLYQILQDTQVERASANAQALTTLSTDAKEWLSTTFYQLLSQTNLKKLARIIPATLFYKIALESVVTRAEVLGNTKFEVKNFASDQEALAWLVK